MRAVSNRNNSSLSSTTSSNTGKNSKTSSGLSASKLLTKIATGSSSGTYSSDKIAQINTNYTAIKKSAAGLQTHTGKLLATGSDSLFTKAMPGNGTSLTDAELSQNKDKVYREINSFIEDYNSMVSNMDSVGGTLNNQYLKQIKGFAAVAQSAFNKIGVKQKSSGTLSVDQKTMKSASMEDLKKVFGSKDGFIAKVSAKSETVESKASSALLSLNSSNSSYDQSGGLISILKNSGNRLNSKG